MDVKRFDKTGLTVSRLCLGTATFGKQSDECMSTGSGGRSFRMAGRNAAGFSVDDCPDGRRNGSMRKPSCYPQLVFI
jgi:hypothetical protein